MATRKTTLKNRTAATPKRRRTTRPAARRTKSGGNFVNIVVPLFLIGCILSCLGFLAFMGYRTVTASEFFDIRRVEIRGASHTSKSDIEKIVAAYTEKSGVWNADLKEIKERVEKLDYVKTVAVSRVLPNAVRVNLVEREPRAVVRLAGGDFWVGDDGLIIAQVGKNERVTSFVIKGWDEGRTDDALQRNLARLKVHQKMLEEWKTFELDKRVRAVDLTDPAQPKATVEDSGETVEIWLPKDNFAKKLQMGLENISGKGTQLAGIDVREIGPKYEFRVKPKAQ